MNEFFQEAVYAGVLVSLICYFFGVWIKNKTGLGFLNPLLIAIVLTILFLVVGHVDYSSYYTGAKYLSYLLTPATICLAVPLYEQLEQLKKYPLAILLGIASGVLTSMSCVLVLSLLFHLDHATYVTLLPKSITTAIGMGVSEEMGGYPSITAAVIIITGVLGNILAELVCKVFRITHPVAKGIGIGSASHAIGTTKAMELGPVEGAMSSLSIVVSGLMTVVAALIFVHGV